MASKKVKSPSSKQSVKKPTSKKKSSTKKTGKSKKKKKTVRKASTHNYVKPVPPIPPIPPLPPLPEEDLREMENARSHFSKNVGESYNEAKAKKLEKAEKSRKASLSEKATEIFDKHKSFCDKVVGLVDNINTLLSQASEVDGAMKDSDLRSYNIDRRLNFHSLVKDLRVASAQLSRITKHAGDMNKVHRDFITQDIQSAKPAFE